MEAERAEKLLRKYSAACQKAGREDSRRMRK